MINAINDSGFIPLMITVLRGDIDILRMLCEFNRNLEKKLNCSVERKTNEGINVDEEMEKYILDLSPSEMNQSADENILQNDDFDVDRLVGINYNAVNHEGLNAVSICLRSRAGINCFKYLLQEHPLFKLNLNTQHEITSLYKIVMLFSEKSVTSKIEYLLYFLDLSRWMYPDFLLHQNSKYWRTH